MDAAYYRSGQAAQMLGTSAHLIRRLCETGLMEAELSDGSQWRIPASEIERLRREGIPPIPSSVDVENGVEREPADTRDDPAENGLLAPPSKGVVISAEDVVVAENRLKKLKIERETEETQDWFRHRKSAKTGAKLGKRRAELERNAQAEAERARTAWFDCWLAIALAAVPRDAPADTLLDVRRAVADTLAEFGPQNSKEVITPLVAGAVTKALRPWLQKEETARAVEAASGTLPWNARAYSEPTNWQVRATAVASSAIRQLPSHSSYDEKLKAGTAAVEPICREFEDYAMRERLLRETYLWEIDYSEREEAKEAIQRAFKELPASTPQKTLERSREQALAPFREARERREREALQQRRLEVRLLHIREYLETLQDAGDVEFEVWWDLSNFANRIQGGIRKAVLEELGRGDLSEEEIDALIEQLVESSLRDS